MREDKNSPKAVLGTEDALALVRSQIVAAFHDENVHGGFAKAFADVPSHLCGVKAGDIAFTL